MSVITYDLSDEMRAEYGADPQPGDVLVSCRRRDGRPTGTIYLIHAVRPVVLRSALRLTRRYRLAVERNGLVGETAGRVWPLFWNPRLRRRGRAPYLP